MRCTMVVSLVVVTWVGSVAQAQAPAAPSFAPAKSAPSPEQPFAHDESPYALRLDIDIATLVLGGALWGGTSLIGNTTAPPFCGGTSTPACDASQLNAFDRLA